MELAARLRTSLVTRLLVLLVAGAAVAVPSAQVAFTTISQGHSSGIEEHREVVVRDAASLADLWKAHAPGVPAPPVDFAESMVVGVFGGVRNTAGHEIEVIGVERDGTAVVVVFRDRRPGRGDIVAQVMTCPHHLVRVPRHDGAVRFRKQPDPGGRL